MSRFRSKRSLALWSWSLAAVALTVGCAGPPIPSPIEGEPVCPDIEMGASHTRMVGGLRYPVRLRVLAGKDLVMKLVMSGKRTVDDKPTHTFVADANDEYTLEWGQCVSERAPRRAGESTKGPKPEGGGYECGDAVVYKTEKLVTKKGDRATHAVTFAPPPNPACWVGDAPRAEAPIVDVVDAGAPPPVAPPPAPADAGSAVIDAGTAVLRDAGAATDAGDAGKKH